MTQEELNLFKFPSSFMAQTAARAAKVVGSNILQTAFRASGLNHAPDDFWAESVFSNPLGFVDGPKYRTCGDASSAQPGVDCRFDPSRHRNRPHEAALAHDIGDYPMLFSLPEAFERQSSYLCSSQAASQQDGNRSMISFAADTAVVEPGKEALALFRGHQLPIRIPCFFTPLTRRIPGARSGLRSPQSAASYASRRTGAKRRLIVEDVMSLFETDPVSGDYVLTESEPRLRAVPVDEFANGVIVRPLGTLRRQAVQAADLFEIRQLQDGFGIAFPFVFGHSSCLHRSWPSTPSAACLGVSHS
jgi:hypothetical protein